VAVLIKWCIVEDHAAGDTGIFDLNLCTFFRVVGLEEAGDFGDLGLIAFGVNDVILYARDGGADAIMLAFLRHLAVHSRCFVFIFSWYSGLLFFLCYF